MFTKYSYQEVETFYKDKKVLVTGYNGFKGTWLCLWLKHLGAKVYGIGMAPSKLATDVKLDNIIDGSYTCDIGTTPTRSIFNEVKPDVTIHLAAQALVRESYEHPFATYQTNVMGTMNVALAAASPECDCKHIVVITTDKCYENDESGFPMRETDRFGGSDPYSSSKGCCEILIESLRRSYSYCNHIITARAGNVIGGGDFSKDRIVPDFFRAQAGKTNLALRNPNSTRPWQHVLEPLYGYLLLGMQSEDLRGVGFNFGPYPNQPHPVIEVVDNLNMFLEQNNFTPVQIEMSTEDNSLKPEAGLLQLDITRATTLLGWKPLLTFDETITLTANWYSAYMDNNNAMQACMNDIDYYERAINQSTNVNKA